MHAKSKELVYARACISCGGGHTQNVVSLFACWLAMLTAALNIVYKTPPPIYPILCFHFTHTRSHSTPAYVDVDVDVLMYTRE